MLFDKLVDRIKGLLLVNSNSVKANDDKNATDIKSSVENLKAEINAVNIKVDALDAKIDTYVAEQAKTNTLIETLIDKLTAKKERAPRKKKVSEDVPTTDKSETEATEKTRKPRTDYSPEHDQFIVENYFHMTTKELVVAFKEKFGMTPLEYRLKHRK